MFGLIKSIRLPECLLIALIGFVGFKYASVQYDLLTLATLFIVIAVTMLQNDWRDRVHDIGKGKSFAYQNPRLFLYFLILFWIIDLVLIIILYFNNQLAASMLLVLSFVGAIYSETRRIPLLPVTIVSLSTASPLLLPLAFGGNFSSVMMLFIATALILLGRETLHDIADTEVDNGYKKTISTFIGDRPARIISTTALIVGCAFAMSVSLITLVGSLFILWGLFTVFQEHKLIKVRQKVDIGLLLLGIGLLFF